MAAAGAAENAEFVLQRDDVDVAEVQEVSGRAVVVQFLFDHLELNFALVGIAAGDVIHRHDDALGAGRLSDRAAQVVSERCDAAFARQVVADESDFQ